MWKIHDIFHVSPLEQDITRKKWVDKIMSRLEIKNDSGSKEYKVKAFCNRKFYATEFDNSHYLPGFYYLILWKGYPKEKNTWKPILAMLHLRKLISTFHQDYLEKLIATCLLIDSALPIARLTVKPRAEASSTKQKHGQLAKANSTIKHSKKSWTSSFLSRFWFCLNSRQKIF